MEKINKVLKLMESLYNELSPEMRDKLKDKLSICEKQNKFDSSFIEIDTPEDFYIKQKISSDDLIKLQDDENTVKIRGTLAFYIKINDKEKKISVVANIGREQRNFLFPLINQDFRNFVSKYRKKKKLLGEATILYSPVLDLFSLHQLKIYTVQDPFEKWIKLMQNKTLLERIETLLSILGLNPKKMLYHEKIIAITRLIPLVVKKVLMVEFSKKNIGKTHSYQSLDLNLYSTDVTKATAFIDGRNKKGGDFFAEDIAFIIDEAHRGKDEQVFTYLQIYMNGEKYKGEIRVTGDDKRETDISPIILGNVRDNINLLEAFSNPKFENGKQVSIFDRTSIVNTIDGGEPFISRITLLPNSWGCRNFASFMKSEEINLYKRELLKEVIPVLRDKKFDVKDFYTKIGVKWESPDIRSALSVEKNFEGLIKLLFPEFIDGINHYEVNTYLLELWFLLERAMEMRKTVDNQLKIINLNENFEQTLPTLSSRLKRVMFDTEKLYFFTPHRVFIKKADGNITKVPLDIIGISLNKREKKILDKINSKNYLVELKNNGILNHTLYYERDILKTISNSGISFCTLPRVNYDINYDPSYNFLTGEIEELDKDSLDFITKYSFYDLDS